MTLTRNKPRIMIVGGTKMQAKLYLERIVPKEKIIRISSEQLITEDVEYLIKSGCSIDSLRGYRCFKQVILIGGLTVEELCKEDKDWVLLNICGDMSRVKEVRTI